MAPEPPKRAALRPALRFLVALILLPVCLAAKVSRIVPPAPAPPVSVNGNQVSVQMGQVEIRAEVLEAPARLRFLRERRATPGEDLFADDPGGRYHFTTFRLEILNGASQEVSLNPAGLRAVVDATHYFSLEYTSAYEYIVSRRHLDPRIVEDLKRAILLDTIVVPPGKRASGLVVFPDLPPRFRRFQILCDSILLGAEGHSFVVPFGVVQEKVRERSGVRSGAPQAEPAHADEPEDGG